MYCAVFISNHILSNHIKKHDTVFYIMRVQYVKHGYIFVWVRSFFTRSQSIKKTGLLDRTTWILVGASWSVSTKKALRITRYCYLKLGFNFIVYENWGARRSVLRQISYTLLFTDSALTISCILYNILINNHMCILIRIPLCFKLNLTLFWTVSFT